MGANYVDLESGYKTSVDTYFDESRQNLLSSYNQYKTQAEQAYNENKKALEDLYEPLKTNYDNLIQNYKNLYAPMANQYTTEQSAYKTQANYDISQAYANYKKQQLNLLQSQRLGTGFKENVSSILKSNYSNLFSGIKKEEAQNLADLEQAYLKKVASNAETIYGLQEDYEKKKASIDTDIESLTTAYNKDLENKEKTYQTELSAINKESADYAKNQYKVARKLFDFAMENNEAEIDNWLAEKQKNGLYEDLTNEDVFLKWMEDKGYLTSTVNTNDMSEEWELSPYGIDYLAQQLFKTNSKGEMFNDWLARTDEEAYKFYNEKDETGALRNQTILKDLLGLYTEKDNQSTYTEKDNQSTYTEKDNQRVYDMGYDEEQGLQRRLTSDKYKELVSNEEPKTLTYDDYGSLSGNKEFKNIGDYVDSLPSEYRKYITSLGLAYEKYKDQIEKIVNDTKNVTKQYDHPFGPAGAPDSKTFVSELNSKLEDLNKKINKDATVTEDALYDSETLNSLLNDTPNFTFLTKDSNKTSQQKRSSYYSTRELKYTDWDTQIRDLDQMVTRYKNYVDSLGLDFSNYENDIKSFVDDVKKSITKEQSASIFKKSGLTVYDTHEKLYNKTQELNKKIKEDALKKYKQ